MPTFWVNRIQIKMPFRLSNRLVARAEQNPVLDDFCRRVEAAGMSGRIRLESIVEADALYAVLDEWLAELGEGDVRQRVQALFNAVKDELHERQDTGEH